MSVPPPPSAHRVAVKICGVADSASAVLSAELGADLLGLNFWPGSPRFVELGLAREIAAAARSAMPGVLLVGVFVNPTAAEVEAAADAAALDLLQFSGDEPAAAVRPFAARAIKGLRLDGRRGPAATPPGAGEMEELLAGFEGCWGLLFDAPRAGAAPAPPTRGRRDRQRDYGGTGRSWDYGAVSPLLSKAGGHRVLLAGGIGPANVRRVAAGLRPFAVDVCSGVESAPGKKDPMLLRQLFEEVRDGQATSAT